jgi:Holliday junction resolvase
MYDINELESFSNLNKFTKQFTKYKWLNQWIEDLKKEAKYYQEEKEDYENQIKGAQEDIEILQKFFKEKGFEKYLSEKYKPSKERFIPLNSSESEDEIPISIMPI